MDDQLEKFLSCDIPEELYLSRNLQTMLARTHVSGATPDEAAKAMLAIALGNLMEIEERLVAVERKVGVAPKPPRDVM